MVINRDVPSLGAFFFGFYRRLNAIFAVGIGFVFLIWGQEKLVPTVVTGAAIEENADLAAVQVRVITAQEWEERGALTVRDGLEMMAGFRCSVHPATPDFAQSSLQGLPGAYIKVLVDGVEITGDIAGATPLEQIGLAGIERIEIVEGSSSVLYGSDAMGGVIHLITSRTSKPHSWSSYIRTGMASTYETFGHIALQGRKQNVQSSLEAQFSVDPGTRQNVRNIYGDAIELFPMPPTQQESARYGLDWKEGRKKVGVSSHVRCQDRRLRDATLFEIMGWGGQMALSRVSSTRLVAWNSRETKCTWWNRFYKRNVGK